MMPVTLAAGAASGVPPARGLRLAIVGPLPPPAGGMANQCRQLAALLEAEGVSVRIVRSNAPYRPAWIERVRGVRAFFRLVPYLVALWRAAGWADVVHLFANSGWAWHFFAAPAVWIARMRGTPVIVNYRGGDAGPFLQRSSRRVLPTLRAAQRLVVPSGFLREVFARHGVTAHVVPNIIDLQRFRPAAQPAAAAPSILLARNLEPIYDVATALRAFALVRAEVGDARLVVAGAGPEAARLAQLAQELHIADAVTFAGRVDNTAMPDYYARATLALNSSTVDNMPISLLEAFASGVPVVSTDVGGVPFIARDRATALLVPARDPAAMAGALLELIRDRALYARLRDAGLADVVRYGWPEVRDLWLRCYADVARDARRVAT